jgi:hypothetical protein
MADDPMFLRARVLGRFYGACCAIAGYEPAEARARLRERLAECAAELCALDDDEARANPLLRLLERDDRADRLSAALELALQSKIAP